MPDPVPVRFALGVERVVRREAVGRQERLCSFPGGLRCFVVRDGRQGHGDPLAPVSSRRNESGTVRPHRGEHPPWAGVVVGAGRVTVGTAPDRDVHVLGTAGSTPNRCANPRSRGRANQISVVPDDVLQCRWQHRDDAPGDAVHVRAPARVVGEVPGADDVLVVRVVIGGAGPVGFVADGAVRFGGACRREGVDLGPQDLKTCRNPPTTHTQIIPSKRTSHVLSR